MQLFYNSPTTLIRIPRSVFLLLVVKWAAAVEWYKPHTSKSSNYFGISSCESKVLQTNDVLRIAKGEMRGRELKFIVTGNSLTAVNTDLIKTVRTGQQFLIYSGTLF